VTEIRVPDIGDFADVPVIEIHVSVGSSVGVEDPLVTLESDKATMDVPAPAAGVVKQLSVAIGDRVSEGSLLLLMEGNSGETDGDAGPAGGAAVLEPATPATGSAPATAAPSAPAPAAPPPTNGARGDHHAELVVLGAGPGGYTAAFRAADLGLKTILIERYPTLGGVCLNVGCIPSKALLHAARVVAEAQEMADHGIRFGKPEVDIDALRSWKESVVGKLTKGIDGLARQRRVEVIHGVARFTGTNILTLDGQTTVSFDHCIIAAGSSPAVLPSLPDDPRIIDSTGALALGALPKRLLVIGGGIIGLEMATVYDALGSRVTVVELLDQLIPGCDPDLVRPLSKRISSRYEDILLGTKVASATAQKNGLKVTFDGDSAPAKSQMFDQVLVAVGRRPNGGLIDAAAAGVSVDESGFIPVDAQMRTNLPHIYAIGDIVGNPMLAHKATHEGKVAAEVIAGDSSVTFDARAIPSVAYTDPEVAWMGLTETEAKASGVAYEKAVFPWTASARALSLARGDGHTKLLFEPGSLRLLGAGMVGINAGELIAETVHALEMGSDAEDIALTIHPHPTLSETVGFSAELAAGTITDLPAPKRS
jgi:dihydrolipoamide dehydrogenase